MKYIKVEWPEIQDYMNNPEYDEECYFDPLKNCWFVPESWSLWLEEKTNWEEYVDEFSGGDIGDLEDAMG